MSTDKSDSSELSDGCSVKILSSWNCVTENGLEKALIVPKTSWMDVDITNLVSTDNCVLLTSKGNGDEITSEACSITLQSFGNAAITDVSLISEARVVEVHGPCEEYLKTVRGEFFLEVEETTVYSVDINLDLPSNYLMLKFNGLPRESDLWLYGVLVRWKPCSRGITSPQLDGSPNCPFNLEAVDRRLTELGHDLGGKSQHYKKILELCNLSGKDSRGNKREVKPSMFAGSQAQQFYRKESATNISPNIELLLEQKLKQLEQNILVQIDKRIDEMEQKQQAFITATFEKMMKQLHLTKNQPLNMD